MARSGRTVGIRKRERTDLHNPANDEFIRLYELMEKYRDTSMDLADASIASLAELHGLY
jgi:hypothetical protein